MKVSYTQSRNGREINWYKVQVSLIPSGRLVFYSEACFLLSRLCIRRGSTVPSP